MTVPDPVAPVVVQVTAAPAPSLYSKPSVLKNVWRGLLAAVTSPTAVKQERSLAAFVVGRVLLSAGASYGVEQFVVRVIGG